MQSACLTAFKPKNCVFIVVTETNVTSGELSVGKSICIFEVSLAKAILHAALKFSSSTVLSPVLMTFLSVWKDIGSAFLVSSSG